MVKVRNYHWFYCLFKLTISGKLVIGLHWRRYGFLEHNTMNLELLESFGQNFPEDFDGALDCVSIAITCAFNRQGTLLGVGCNDGRIVIWDFLTRGIAKIISAHVHPVCSLSWSRDGRKLLSAATDNTVSVWDVFLGECDKTYRFPSPILKVQFHPR